MTNNNYQYRIMEFPFKQNQKTLLLTFILGIFTFFNANGQVAESINYQAVARDANQNILANQSINVKIGVLSTSTSGTLEYEEEFNPTTSAYGLFTLQIGKGSPTGNGAKLTFSDINWAGNSHFLKVEIKNNSGVYEDLGTTQLVSVPYALYAKSSGNGDGKNSLTSIVNEASGANCTNGGSKVNVGLDANNNDTLEASEIQLSYYVCNGLDGAALNAGDGIKISNDTIINLGDLANTNELIDSITLNNSILNIYENGNLKSIDLDTLGNYKIAAIQNHIATDFDTDSLNERIASIQLVNDTIVLVENDSVFKIGLSNLNQAARAALQTQITTNASFIANHITSDADMDSTNEKINSITIFNDTLIINENGTLYKVNLDTIGNQERQLIENALNAHITADKDISKTNELITAITLNSFGELKIFEGTNSKTISLDALNTDSQTVYLSALKDSLYISNGNGIDLPDPFTDNELIDSIKVIGTNLVIYEGGLSKTISLAKFNNLKGVGIANRIPFYINSDSLITSNDYVWNNANKRLGIGTNSPSAKLDVRGAIRINNAIAAPQQGMIQWNGSDFQGYDGANWVSLTTGVVNTCPAGMTLSGNLCIETNERAAATWFVAASTCNSLGYKLPSWAEWFAAADNAALTGETNNWEWIDNATIGNAGIVGNGSINAISNVAPTLSHAYRCAIYLK